MSAHESALSLLEKLASLPHNEYCILSSGEMDYALIQICRRQGDFYTAPNGLGFGIVKYHRGRK